MCILEGQERLEECSVEDCFLKRSGVNEESSKKVVLSSLKFVRRLSPSCCLFLLKTLDASKSGLHLDFEFSYPDFSLTQDARVWEKNSLIKQLCTFSLRSFWQCPSLHRSCQRTFVKEDCFVVWSFSWKILKDRKDVACRRKSLILAITFDSEREGWRLCEMIEKGEGIWEACRIQD
jgi:hypothetical protein